MLIRYGYDITIESDGPLSMLLQMSVRPERQLDLRGIEAFSTDPAVPYSTFIDDFGNFTRRLNADPGKFRMQQTAIITDSGLPEPEFPEAQEMPIEALPDDVLQFLMPSRYCDSDLLLAQAWDLFGQVPQGWNRVQAIMDWVHNHITFNYQDADATRTAKDAFDQGKGVCRDFAHLAIAMCRALNIPARYVNAHLGDFGVPVPPDPMDYAASVQVYLSGRWWNFDPRNNSRRIGRIPVGYGRDATDVALISSFGAHRLLNFTVITEEVDEAGNRIEQRRKSA
ncbi:Transglutaminase-like enzyme, putative cysteine protease [Paracoccus isoporae]|uniref:Transglutaminase-like enzyme, putative cysteine protease n=1 Tax=Paracoccus isoporae TaxID=591205 RepID=A0A1G6WYX4_9RHOB|nr:transglutaminase family protein [Paracoccus isoporae]SDD70246.1 Transglutaminase-like enzyme, putative cysteine protease [Paracoccus isoporae]